MYRNSSNSDNSFGRLLHVSIQRMIVVGYLAKAILCEFLNFSLSEALLLLQFHQKS